MSPSLESLWVRIWFVLTFHIFQGERMQTSSVVSSVALKAMWAMRVRRMCSAHVSHQRKKQNKNRSRSWLNDSRHVQKKRRHSNSAFVLYPRWALELTLWVTEWAKCELRALQPTYLSLSYNRHHIARLSTKHTEYRPIFLVRNTSRLHPRVNERCNNRTMLQWQHSAILMSNYVGSFDLWFYVFEFHGSLTFKIKMMEFSGFLENTKIGLCFIGLHFLSASNISSDIHQFIAIPCILLECASSLVFIAPRNPVLSFDLVVWSSALL